MNKNKNPQTYTVNTFRLRTLCVVFHIVGNFGLDDAESEKLLDQTCGYFGSKNSVFANCGLFRVALVASENGK